MSAELAETLVELLDQEHEALIGSNFGELEALLQKKEELAKLIRNSPPKFDNKSLEVIIEKAKSNDLLFEASLKGIRSTIEKITEVRQTYGQLKTYDGAGQLSTRRTLSPSISKKA